MDENTVFAIVNALSNNAEEINITEPSIRSAPIPLVVVPKGNGIHEIESIKDLLEPWRERPERRTGCANVETLESFMNLTNRHKTADSALFAAITASQPALIAVIDYHAIDGTPNWRGHRVVYRWPLSPEWQAWTKQDGQRMSQQAWAEWVEDHIAELAAPTDEEIAEHGAKFQTTLATPAELVQMSRGMEVTAESRVKQVRVLQSGEAEVVYEEAHRDGTGGKLVVPGLFIVNVPLFVGAPPSRVLARLRYRLSEGKLAWFFQLYRAAEAVNERMAADMVAASAATSLPAYRGTPE